MISEKDYLSSIKKFRIYNTPKDLNQSVLIKCGLSTIPTDKKNKSYKMSEFQYGIASLAIFLAILIISMQCNNQSPDYSRISLNSKALGSQLLQGVYVVFTEAKKL